MSVRPSYVLISVRASIFSFPDDNLSKYQWTFTKLGICIDIVQVWFWIANGQISPIFKEICNRDTSIFSCPRDNLNKNQWLFTKLGLCIDIVKNWFEIANGPILSISDKGICPRHVRISVAG